MVPNQFVKNTNSGALLLLNLSQSLNDIKPPLLMAVVKSYRKAIYLDAAFAACQIIN